MKIYFTVWGYCDPNRVGYDSVGASFYGKEKPQPFAGVGSVSVYEVEVSDDLTDEEIKKLGKSAIKYMEKVNDYNPRLAVNKILSEKIEI